MAAIPVTLDGFLYDLFGRTTQRVIFMGEASLTGLGLGGGPIAPPAGGGQPPLATWGPTVPRPPPPIYLPPGGGGQPPLGMWGPPGPWPTPPIYLPPMPSEPPPDQGVGKPPPPEGGWGWHPDYGWGYFPGGGGKPQPGPGGEKAPRRS